MRRVELSTGDWNASGYVARSFADRLLGMWRVPVGSALLMSTRSVHTFGRREPIEVVGLDSGMRVVATMTLEPNRITVLSSSRMIVELPGGRPVPTAGDRVEVSYG